MIFLKMCYLAIDFLKIHDSQQYSKIEPHKETTPNKIYVITRNT